MPDHVTDEELAPEQTEGFKVGEKKTIDEYQKLDQNDESLRKWKESLGLGTGETLSDPNDPRKCIILSLGLEVEGRPDIIIDVSQPGQLESLKDKPFTIKEGATFRMKVRFRVQHQILSGMKYLQVVKRLKISQKTQEMIGSYSPNTADKPDYEKKFEPDTAPSGMLARGHYTAVSKFVDDDNETHLQFNWAFDITKDCMFGLLISSRPVLTPASPSAQTISPTQLAFTLPTTPSFSHIVVFLLPDTTLPADSAAAVYLKLPTASDFSLLGALTNEKPSAIFQVRGNVAGDADAMSDGAGDVTVGIALEGREQCLANVAGLKQQQQVGMEVVRAGQAPNAATTKVLAQKIIANAFNFLASFGSDVIPLRAFEEWWKKFERKIELDPGFLEREQ